MELRISRASGRPDTIWRVIRRLAALIVVVAALSVAADLTPGLREAAAALERGDFSTAETKLRAELKPGTRVVVHDFPFPDWQPEKAIMVESLDKIQVTGFALSQLYLYRVPERR